MEIAYAHMTPSWLHHGAADTGEALNSRSNLETNEHIFRLAACKLSAKLRNCDEASVAVEKKVGNTRIGFKL